MTVFSAGSVIADKYRVVHKIGEGGYGVVLACDHLQMPSRVAIKVLKNSASDIALERFYREARVLAQMQSDHVTRVYDVGALASGEPYLVMELLEGTDLSKMRKTRGALPVAEAVDYVLQACVGIAEAHLEGVIHRDIKPANLFVATLKDQRRVVKVLDFGISKANEAASGPGTALTETGAMFGSPRFMSPEQLRSTKDVDERGDIWSLAMTLYELLAGKPAFHAPNMADLVMKILGERPAPLPVVAPHVPDALDAVIRKCIERDPAARYPSIAALAVALAPFSPERGGWWVERIHALYQAKNLPPPAPPSAQPTSAASAPTHSMTTAMTGTGAAAAQPAGQPAGEPAASAAPSTSPVQHDAPKTRSVWPLIAALLVLGMGGVAAWIALGGSSSTSANATATKASTDGKRKKKGKRRKSADPAKKKSKKDRSKPDAHNRAKAIVARIPDGAAFFHHGEELRSAVAAVHDGPLRYYDVIVHDSRARFVVERGNALVIYDVTRSGVDGPGPFELASAERLDGVLLDDDAVSVKAIGKVARTVGPERLFSVSLRRDGRGFGWQASLSSGAFERFDLSGNPQ